MNNADIKAKFAAFKTLLAEAGYQYGEDATANAYVGYDLAQQQHGADLCAMIDAVCNRLDTLELPVSDDVHDAIQRFSDAVDRLATRDLGYIEARERAEQQGFDPDDHVPGADDA